MISLTSLRNPLISFLLFLFYHYTMMLSLAFSEVPENGTINEIAVPMGQLLTFCYI